MRFAIPFFLLITICTPAFTLELNPDFKESLYLLNNSQLLEAYESTKSLEEKYSDSEEFLFLKAMIKWKMMWLSTYNKTDREEVIGLLDRADILCEKKDGNLDARFFQAAVTGLRAQVFATEGDWWKTAKLGKKMKESALQIIESDSEFFPAYYLLGSYNYFADGAATEQF